jgi:hypothetical protein
VRHWFPGLILPALERDLLHNTFLLYLALASSACGAGRLANDNNISVGCKGGGTQNSQKSINTLNPPTLLNP